MIAKTDSKKRVLLSSACPGDVFDIQKLGEGQFMLVRLERPSSPGRMTRSQCLRALETTPLKPRMTWEELRSLTREA